MSKGHKWPPGGEATCRRGCGLRRMKVGSGRFLYRKEGEAQTHDIPPRCDGKAPVVVATSACACCGGAFAMVHNCRNPAPIPFCACSTHPRARAA